MTDRELDDLQRMTFAFPEIHIVRKAFRDLIAEVLRLKAEREWQPIETAPKDERVLVCWPSGLMTTSRYSDELDDWLPAMATGRDPTHWMPLPELLE